MAKKRKKAANNEGSMSYDKKRKEIFKPEFLFDHFPSQMVITPTKSATSGYSIFDTEKPYSFFMLLFMEIINSLKG